MNSSAGEAATAGRKASVPLRETPVAPNLGALKLAVAQVPTVLPDVPVSVRRSVPLVVVQKVVVQKVIAVVQSDRLPVVSDVAQKVVVLKVVVLKVAVLMVIAVVQWDRLPVMSDVVQKVVVQKVVVQKVVVQKVVVQKVVVQKDVVQKDVAQKVTVVVRWDRLPAVIDAVPTVPARNLEQEFQIARQLLAARVDVSDVRLRSLSSQNICRRAASAAVRSRCNSRGGGFRRRST
jgi:hypothetical protein